MCSVALDDDLQALAGFPAIEDTEPEVDPEIGPDYIDELARDIEVSIDEWQEYIDEDMPDFISRNELQSPITISQLIERHKQND